jgi:hypothetical protein
MLGLRSPSAYRANEYSGGANMKLAVVCFWALYMMMVGCVLAGELSEVEMRDGSVIQAEVISLDGNHYTLRSDSLGTFSVERSKVKGIRMKASEGVTIEDGKGPQALTNGQIKALQERMISDKNILDMIVSLQNDPDFQAVMSDPDVMKAVSSGDMSALMSNPKFLKLLDKPEVQHIGKGSLE